MRPAERAVVKRPSCEGESEKSRAMAASAGPMMVMHTPQQRIERYEVIAALFISYPVRWPVFQ
jgi:hypothetical protein